MNEQIFALAESVVQEEIKERTPERFARTTVVDRRVIKEHLSPGLYDSLKQIESSLSIDEKLTLKN